MIDVPSTIATAIRTSNYASATQRSLVRKQEGTLMCFSWSRVPRLPRSLSILIFTASLCQVSLLASASSIATAAEVVTQSSSQNKPNFTKQKAAQVNPCAGVPGNQLGKCTINNPPENLDMYCTACCALREALTWIPPVGAPIACH